MSDSDDHLTLMPQTDQDNYDKAKESLDRINQPGYYKVIAALARARRVPSNVLAKGVDASVGEIEKYKAKFVKEMNEMKDHAVDLKAITDSLSRIRFEDMKFELLDLLKQDMNNGSMDAKTKVSFMQFLHAETKDTTKKGEAGKSDELTDEQIKERIDRLARK